MSGVKRPMLGVPKMSVGVSLPHFTSPSSNGGQIGFFSSAPTLTVQKKYKKIFFQGNVFFEVSKLSTCQHSHDT